MTSVAFAVGLEVLGEPLDPELLLLDAAAQDQPGVEVAGRSSAVGVGELLALELLEVASRVRCSATRSSRWASSCARSPYDAPRIFTATSERSVHRRRGGADPLARAPVAGGV